MKFTNSILSVCALALLFFGCNIIGGNPDGPQAIEKDGDRVFIVDQTGKKWEVSHAEKKYGMKPGDFQFGLGPNAIRPILEPRMLSEGDPGYPNDNSSFLVLGTEINGDARAYPINVMSAREVADEKFDTTHVAVAYWPLVDLAAVYSREIDGQVLTLAASGWTYEYTFVLYDFETESLWYHLEGTTGLTCISGKFKDRKLEELSSLKTRWSNWKQQHPNTKFMRF